MKRSKTQYTQKHKRHINTIAKSLQEVGFSTREALRHALAVVNKMLSTKPKKSKTKSKKLQRASRPA